jgi:hypothetical protein
VTLDAILDHFRARGLDVIETRRGAVVRCPGHDDTRPSLHLTAGRDGRTLGICRAGCRVDDWTAASGLRLGDLFPTTTTAPVPRRRPRSPLAIARSEAIALARRQAWAKPGVVERYAAADALRVADHVRRQAEDSDAGWERLAEAAGVTTLAENVLSGGDA